ncbi:MAG: TRAP-type C4-dicarboxylate transport system substrate-binding protein, partial [Oceanospirillaceae bacterium]
MIFGDSFILAFKYRGQLLSQILVMSFIGLLTLQAKAVDWKMPVANDSHNFQGQLALGFAKQVKKATQNRIVIKPYLGGSLFKGEQIFGAVSNNLAPVGARLISALGHVDIVLQLDALPFLAKNYREAFKLYKSSKNAVEKVLENKGVKLLYAVPWPAQGLYSNRSISKLSDFKNLRFRPYSKITANLGEKLGLNPVIMPVSQLPKALRKKQLDLLFGSALAAEKLKLSKYFPFWYDLQAWLPKTMMVINLKQWNALSKADRKGILKAANMIEAQGWARSKKVSEDAKRRLIESGVSVVSFDAQ